MKVALSLFFLAAFNVESKPETSKVKTKGDKEVQGEDSSHNVMTN